MDQALEKRLRDLADQQEIAAVLNAYAHGVDRRQGALVMSCFHADATFQYLDETPAPVAAFFAATGPNGEGLATTHHLLSNHMVAIQGDAADSQIYVWGYHLISADAPDRPPLFPAKGKAYGVVIGGRYVDRFERRDGLWRISQRRLVFDWSFNTEAPEFPLPPWAAREGGFEPRLPGPT